MSRLEIAPLSALVLAGAVSAGVLAACAHEGAGSATASADGAKKLVVASTAAAATGAPPAGALSPGADAPAVATTAASTTSTAASDSTAASAARSAHAAARAPDESALTPREREEYESSIDELVAPCADVAASISECLAHERACRRCGSAAAFVMRSVRAGKSREEIAQAYQRRFDPGSARAVPVDGPLVVGPASARVTVVAIMDLQCPACQAELPMLDAMAARHPGDVRLVVRLVALPAHANAEDAARAAYAAAWQGKGWEMLRGLADAGAHDPAAGAGAFAPHALEGDARTLGLDVGRFRLDMSSQRTTDRLTKDQGVFDALKCDHTPTVFVNGRDTDANDVESVVNDEL